MLCLSAGFAQASAEGAIQIMVSHIEIRAGESGYLFKFDLNKKGDLIKMEAIWLNNGLTIRKTLTEKDFGKVDAAKIKNVKVYAPQTVASGVQNEVIVALPYSCDFYDIEGAIVERENIVRLRFLKGELIEWTKAIIDTKNKNLWLMTGWDSKTGQMMENRIKSKKNPYER